MVNKEKTMILEQCRYLVVAGLGVGLALGTLGCEGTVPQPTSPSSVMEPHALPTKGPWFEGWYARFTPENPQEPTVGVIVGSHLPADASGTEALRSGSPGFASVLLSQGKDLPLKVFEQRVARTFLLGPDGKVVDQDPVPGLNAQFEWRAQGTGHLTAKAIELASSHGWQFQAKLGTPRQGVLSSLFGPEGPAVLSKALPIHWYVYGQDIPAVWEFASNTSQGVSKGKGTAHFEKNWGRAFPERYIWLQGTDARTGSSIAAAGGSLGIAGTNRLQAHLVVIKKGKRSWTFSPVTGAVFGRADVDACTGNFRLEMRSVEAELVLSARAPRASFADILIPTSGGFEPGSEQSFASTIEATIRTREGEVFEIPIQSGGLEFGGAYKCRS
jgi:hypothetical protein